MKQKNIDFLNNQIESNLFLLGSTAINDDLQDDLEETLEFFIKAGIKIWVLTGDKFDTAKSIALSSNLISRQTRILEIKNIDCPEKMNKKLDEFILSYLHDKNQKIFSESKLKSGNIFENEGSLVNSFHIYNHEMNFGIESNTKYSIIIESEELEIIFSDITLENKVIFFLNIVLSYFEKMFIRYLQ